MVIAECAHRLALLQAIPAETLFSLSSRHHRLWGFGSGEATCKVLFGGRRAGVHHDIPSAVGYFSATTQGAYGTASRLALGRTLLSFYAPFLPPEEVVRAIKTMSGDSVAHLKFRLGLLTSRFRAHHPLKACEHCLADDVRDHGWACWHLEHQFPGVWFCSRHCVRLLECTVKSNGVERFLWQLPTPERLKPSWPESGEKHDEVCRFACLVTGLIGKSNPPGWLQAAVVQPLLCRRLHECGWMSSSGRLRLGPASEAFASRLDALRLLPELARLDVSENLARAWIGRLGRPLRSGVHPLILLLAINWLFEGEEEFADCYRRGPADAHATGSVTQATFSISNDVLSDKTEAIGRLKQGESARSVSKALGIDVGTAMAWGAEAGVRPGRRPKTLIQPVRDAAIGSLAKGQTKSETAWGAGVSLQAVTRLLRTEPGLRDKWKAASFKQAQRRMRSEWLHHSKRNPEAGGKLLRAHCPAAYAWLYRNDRDWLRQHCPAPAKRSAPRAAVRWEQRDQCLRDAVEAAAQRLKSVCPQRLIKLWELVQQVPELKPKLSALRRLPQTSTAIDRAIGRSARRHAD